MENLIDVNFSALNCSCKNCSLPLYGKAVVDTEQELLGASRRLRASLVSESQIHSAQRIAHPGSTNTLAEQLHERLQVEAFLTLLCEHVMPRNHTSDSKGPCQHVPQRAQLGRLQTLLPSTSCAAAWSSGEHHRVSVYMPYRCKMSKPLQFSPRAGLRGTGLLC